MPSKPDLANVHFLGIFPNGQMRMRCAETSSFFDGCFALKEDYNKQKLQYRSDVPLILESDDDALLSFDVEISDKFVRLYEKSGNG